MRLMVWLSLMPTALKNFVMRYEEPSVEGTEVLGTNSWIDFSGDVPKLLD